MKFQVVLFGVLYLCALALCAPYKVPDTNQKYAFNDNVGLNAPPTNEKDDYWGQDAYYSSYEQLFVDSKDGTVSDLVTGLMWLKDPGDRVTYSAGQSGASSCSTGGYSDWRVPTIKELYTLIQFSGTDPSGPDEVPATPFIDTSVFSFAYGSSPFRQIDVQYLTNTEYVDAVSAQMPEWFGTNFADGRIKGYPKSPAQNPDQFFALYVRGNASTVGVNSFFDLGGGIVYDNATGLFWMQADSGSGMNWKSALSYCNDLALGGHNDWRLPNVKELQSIVDYTRSPGTSASAAINAIFSVTGITNEAGSADFPYFWSSTTHESAFGDETGHWGCYVCFGRCMGYFNNQWMDVHGAGAQRSDPKSGDPGEYPHGHGPQGDAVRINNFVRCVRDGVSTISTPEAFPKTTSNGSVLRIGLTGLFASIFL